LTERNIAGGSLVDDPWPARAPAFA